MLFPGLVLAWSLSLSSMEGIGLVNSSGSMAHYDIASLVWLIPWSNRPWWLFINSKLSVDHWTNVLIREQRTYEPRHDKTNNVSCAPSETSDQPGHPPNLIRVFAVRMKKTLVLSYPLSSQRRLWSDWADAQADLSLRWAHRSFCWFCHEAALIMPVSRKLAIIIRLL